MGLKVEAFNREITAFQRALEPDAMKAQLAQLAKKALGEAIASGEASPDFIRFVNGRRDVPEEAVQLPGPIVYVFSWLPEAAAFAVAFLESRYPVIGPEKGGHYRDRHIVLVNGRAWKGGPIAADAEVIVVNTQPYARKVQVGARGFMLSRGLYEDARQALIRKFRGLIDVELRFIRLSNGYVLKGHERLRPAKSNRKSSAFRAGHATLARRKDTAAGQPMTYPALVLNRIFD